MLADLNYGVLKKKNPKIYEELSNVESNSHEYQVVISKIGQPTIKIVKENRTTFLHSKYNPIDEAMLMVDEYYCQTINAYFVYGFGLGYHIEELLKRNPKSNIMICEANQYIFKLALENRDLTKILENENVQIILSKDLISFSKAFNIGLIEKNSRLVIHMPSLNAIPQQLVQLKYLLEDFKVRENTIDKYKEMMNYNFYKNIDKYDYCISSLFNKFKELPIILISAGPSLEKNIRLLKYAKGKAILMAVGTALKPLIKLDIEPDIVIITDPQDVVTNQLENVSISIPIIVLSTANYKLLESYRGYKFIAFQQGYYPAEEYVQDAKEKLVKTGGSVATTALDIGLKLGCNPIVFVGHDLAFTNGESHIKGTYFYDKILDTFYLRPIKDQNNGIVYTSKNLFQYHKWIENRIKHEKDKLFINATEGGAFIEGTQHMDFNTVISSYLANQIVDFKYKLQQEIFKDESNI